MLKSANKPIVYHIVSNNTRYLYSKLSTECNIYNILSSALYYHSEEFSSEINSYYFDDIKSDREFSKKKP